MRKLILLLLLFPLFVNAQTVGIKVATPIIKNNPADNTITGYANLLNGGYRILETLAERDSITNYYTAYVKPYMIAYVRQTDSTYQLRGGVATSNWVAVAPGNINGAFMHLTGNVNDVANGIKTFAPNIAVTADNQTFNTFTVNPSVSNTGGFLAPTLTARFNNIRLLASSYRGLDGIGGVTAFGGTTTLGGDNRIRLQTVGMGSQTIFEGGVTTGNTTVRPYHSEFVVNVAPDGGGVKIGGAGAVVSPTSSKLVIGTQISQRLQPLHNTDTLILVQIDSTYSFGTGNAIASYDNLVGGSGYNDGLYTNVDVLNGSGSGAKATVTVSGGAITVVLFTNGGGGYVVGDFVNFSTTAIGTGGGTSGRVRVASLAQYTGAMKRGLVVKTVEKSEFNGKIDVNQTIADADSSNTLSNTKWVKRQISGASGSQNLQSVTNNGYVTTNPIVTLSHAIQGDSSLLYRLLYVIGTSIEKAIGTGGVKSPDSAYVAMSSFATGYICFNRGLANRTVQQPDTLVADSSLYSVRNTIPIPATANSVLYLTGNINDEGRDSLIYTIPIFTAQYNTIIATAKSKGWTRIVIANPSFRSTGASISRQDAYAAALVSIAAANNVLLFDGYTPFKAAYLGGDTGLLEPAGLHPTQRGQNFIANLLTIFLRANFSPSTNLANVKLSTYGSTYTMGKQTVQDNTYLLKELTVTRKTTLNDTLNVNSQFLILADNSGINTRKRGNIQAYTYAGITRDILAYDFNTTTSQLTIGGTVAGTTTQLSLNTATSISTTPVTRLRAFISGNVGVSNVGAPSDVAGWAFNSQGGISLSGAFSKSAWGTTGPLLNLSRTTVTDTSTAAGATTSNLVFGSVKSQNIVASKATSGSPVVYTNGYNMYFDVAPTSGANTTITNSFSAGFAGLSRHLAGLYAGSSDQFKIGATGIVTNGTWNGTNIGVAFGGTGQSSYTNGQLLIGNTTGNTLTKATLTAGSGVSITNGTGSITINATGSGGTVTNFSKVDGYGIISSVANPTTTPVLTHAVDTTNVTGIATKSVLNQYGKLNANNVFTGSNTFNAATSFNAAINTTSVINLNNNSAVSWGNSTFRNNLSSATLTATRNILLPDASGTVALTSDLALYGRLALPNTWTDNNTFSSQVITQNAFSVQNGYPVGFVNPGGFVTSLYGNNATANRSIYLPDAGGTILLDATTPNILSTITGIDAKSTGTTALYTVPSGKTAVITAAIVRCTAATAITIGPSADIGDSITGAASIYANTAITALTAPPKAFGYSSVGMFNSVATSGIINFNINTAATGTSQTISVTLIGYLQ